MEKREIQWDGIRWKCCIAQENSNVEVNTAGARTQRVRKGRYDKLAILKKC